MKKSRVHRAATTRTADTASSNAKAQANRGNIASGRMLQLQSDAGNRAVQRLVQPDRATDPIQRASPEEEEELVMGMRQKKGSNGKRRGGPEEEELMM